MEQKPLRILHIIGIVTRGGVESVVLNYYRHVDRSKVQFDFVVHDNDTVDISDTIEALGGKVYKVPAYNKNIGGFMSHIYRIVKDNHYDIIHSHMTTLGVFSLGPAWLAGCKTRILHGHSTTVASERARNIMKMVLRPFSKYVANHFFACGRLVADWLYGNTSKPVTIINNAVDMDQFHYDEDKRNQLRREFGLDRNFVIGHVGRFMYQKNHEYLVRLFAKVADRMPEARLVLVGDGPLREHILDLIKELGIEDKVQYLGIRTDVHDLYNMFDVFYLPSWYEGLAVVSVEAQANSLPIIMSEYVTDEAVIDDELACRLGIDDADMDAWIEQTKWIQSQQGLRGKSPDALRQKGFDIRQEAAKLEQLYEEFYREK